MSRQSELQAICRKTLRDRTGMLEGQQSWTTEDSKTSPCWWAGNEKSNRACKKTLESEAQKEGLLRKGAHHLFFIEDQKRRSLNYLCDAGFRQKEGLSGRMHAVTSLTEGEFMGSYKAVFPTGQLLGEILAGPCIFLQHFKNCTYLLA